MTDRVPMPRYSPEEDDRLIADRAAGIKVAETALALGRSQFSVYTRLSILRRKMGVELPNAAAQGGREGTRPWTTTDIARMRELVALGKTSEQIAAELDRTTCSVKARRERERGADREPSVDVANQRRRIPCLNCGSTFTSEGFHNRLCRHCRYSASTASPYAP